MSDDANGVITSYIEAMSLDTEDTLRSINMKLGQIVKSDGLMISQTSLKQLAKEEQQVERAQQARSKRDQAFQQRRDRAASGTNKTSSKNQYDLGDDSIFKRKDKKRTFDKLFDDVEDAFRKELLGSSKPFSDMLRNSMSQFAKSLNTDVDQLGKEIGKRFGKMAKKTWVGQRAAAEMDWWKDKAAGAANAALNRASVALGGKGGINITQDLKDMFEPEKELNMDNIDDAVNTNITTLDDDIRSYFETLDQTVRQSATDLGAKVEAIIYGSSQEAERVEGEVIEENRPSANLPQVTQPNNDEQQAEREIDVSVPEWMQGFDEGIQHFGGEIDNFINGALSGLSQAVPGVGEGLNALQGMFPLVESGMEGMAVGFPQLTAALGVGALGVEALTAAIGFLVKKGIQALSNAMEPAVEGFKSFGKAASQAANRDISLNTKYTELRKKRIEDDTRSVREAAFAVIEESAKKVEEVWDQVEGTIAASQGYTKDAVQDLWSAYADRLEKEGMAGVVSSADIMSNLESVLQQGLNGLIAEEFAYTATVLKDAVPTEDFFQYASTYASIAANAIKNGKSQEEAISLANQELESFASNLLYASRQVAGGITTGLNDGADLFKKAAEITVASANAGIEADTSDVSGVLTSVAAIVGGIAPDLASSMVDAVYAAATGGNSSELTALRSMAGVGASNTAFLKALATDPQSIFANLFTNLSQLQNSATGNYMEVAEALSSVFGMSREAFTRVDFDYLASAITKMNVNNDELNNNMDLLLSGQTKSSAEQLRIQKINEYMIEEGLAYVLDNEVARSVQEHMWDEQLARQITESTFAVDLQGGALDLLNGVMTTITKIGNIVNPISWIKQGANLVATAVQGVAQHEDLKTILKEGAIGVGNAESLRDLTTSGVNLGLANPYVTYYGVASRDQLASEAIQNMNNAFHPITGLAASLIKSAGDAVTSIVAKSQRAAQQATRKSSYYTYSTPTTSAQAGITASAASITSAKQATADLLTTSASSAAGQEVAGEEDIKEVTSDQAKDYIKDLKSVIDARFTKTANALTKVNDVLEKSTRNLDSQITDINDLDNTKYRNFYTQSSLQTALQEATSSDAYTKAMEDLTKAGGSVSFDQWVTQYEEMRQLTDKNYSLAAELSNYGQSIESLRSYYEQKDSEQASLQSQARELHEVQFWEDMQHFATIDFPWYMREWQRYYIEHEAYNTATDNAAQKLVENQQLRDDASKGVVVDKLAELLAKTDIWNEKNLQALSDPAVQTNVLLARLLVVAEAIEHQNNESSIVSVPTALSALGLGLTQTK